MSGRWVQAGLDRAELRELRAALDRMADRAAAELEGGPAAWVARAVEDVKFDAAVARELARGRHAEEL